MGQMGADFAGAAGLPAQSPGGGKEGWMKATPPGRPLSLLPVV